MVPRARQTRAAVLLAATLAVMVLCLPCEACDDVAKPRPPSDLPIGHWAYPLLERLSARGVLSLDMTTLPLSRSDVASELAARNGATENPAGRGLSPRERWALDALAAEFLRGEVEEPVFSRVSGGAALGFGLLLGSEVLYDSEGAGESSGSGSDIDASIDVTYELWGGVGRRLGFYADTSILLEGQDGPRVEALSSRARTWRGTAVHADRAYLKYEGEHLSAAVGRRGVAWGRSPGGRLLLSGGAPTLDCVEARFTVGALELQALHSFLERTELDELGGADSLAQASGQTFLAAHRAVFSGSWGSVGVGEAVVYSGDLPDPSYLNPLLPYYVSQHNERADDNILWALDFLARPLSGLDLWGEFLVDDLQYDRDTGAPDKYGATVGAKYFGTLGRGDYEATWEYTNVRKWTYTHHVAGHRYTHDGEPLGFELGPDADRLSAEVAYHPWPRWTCGAGYSFSREGDGNIGLPFQKGEDDEPTFPSGNVTKTHRAKAFLEYDRPGRFSASLGGSLAFQTDDEEDDDSYEVWARVLFRI